MSRKLDFQKLVDGADQLNRDIDPGYAIQRNVEQINESAQRLASKSVATSTDYSRNKAYALLAQKGVDPDKLTRNLQAIDLKIDTSIAEPLADTDIETYLQFEHENTIVAAIEEAKKETITQYRTSYDEMLHADWERSKRELLESMGQNLSTALPMKSPFKSPAPTALIQGAPHVPKSMTKMDERMMQYAQVVGRVNDTRSLGSAGRISVLTQFCDVAQRMVDRFPDPRAGELLDAWNLLRQMMEEHKQVHPEGAFKTRNQPTNDLYTQKVFLAGTLEFLQNQYLRIMEVQISQHPETAMRGGEPSLQHTIRAYLKVLFYERPDKNLELLPSGEPIWPMLYFCLRCGSLKEALNIVKPVGNALGNFTTYLEVYARNSERSLPSDMWAQCCAEFNSSIKRSKDPYKILVWNIIGRCEVHEFGPFRQVIASAQDFLWYKLMLTRISNDPLPEQLRAQDLPLYSIQTQVLELGASYFNPQGKTPLLYLFVLLSVQLFEQAIEFLYTGTDRYQVDAIHMAVGLYYYDALRLPAINRPRDTLPPPTLMEVVPIELLISSGGPVQLNFYRLIYDYTSRLSAPAEALQYVCLFRDDMVRDLAVKDLAVSSQEYDLLLGYPVPDGTIKPGLVQKILPRKAREITALVAETAKENGNYDDAIRLYELCGDIESMIKLISNRLSSIVTARAPERDRLFHTAAVLHQRAKSSPSANVPPSLFAEFEQLLSIGKFFTLFNEGKHEEAIVYLTHTKILPFEASDVSICVENFKRWSPTLTRLLPELLLAAMTCLGALFDTTKITQYGAPGVVAYNDGGRETRLLRLRSMAHALVTFSGMVPHRMPGDVNARLLSMEVMMK